MPALPVIEHFEVLEERRAGLDVRANGLPREEFTL
jgi:hypothetical protein